MITTGILLAVARISGETAPLLFTALNNQFWNSNMNAPMANLPIVIFQFAMSPYELAHPGLGRLAADHLQRADPQHPRPLVRQPANFFALRREHHDRLHQAPGQESELLLRRLSTP